MRFALDPCTLRDPMDLRGVMELSRRIEFDSIEILHAARY
jgi:hypothetical protein